MPTVLFCGSDAQNRSSRDATVPWEAAKAEKGIADPASSVPVCWTKARREIFIVSGEPPASEREMSGARESRHGQNRTASAYSSAGPTCGYYHVKRSANCILRMVA